jgi:hypothetical protein
VIRYGGIFKLRNPIRSFRDKWVDYLKRVKVIKCEFKDSEMNKGGE